MHGHKFDKAGDGDGGGGCYPINITRAVIPLSWCGRRSAYVRAEGPQGNLTRSQVALNEGATECERSGFRQRRSGVREVQQHFDLAGFGESLESFGVAGKG